MGTLLFDRAALDLLSRATYDPRARRGYEIMSDCFFWSDELLWEAFREFGTAWPFRELFGYRRSVMLASPDLRFRPLWEQVASECPGWPGLRPERASPALVPYLLRARRKACVELLRLEREMERAESAD